MPKSRAIPLPTGGVLKQQTNWPMVFKKEEEGNGEGSVGKRTALKGNRARGLQTVVGGVEG